jgi:hypothetical protein
MWIWCKFLATQTQHLNDISALQGKNNNIYYIFSSIQRCSVDIKKMAHVYAFSFANMIPVPHLKDSFAQ